MHGNADTLIVLATANPMLTSLLAIYLVIGIGWCSAVLSFVVREEGVFTAFGFALFILAIWPFTLGKLLGSLHRTKLFGSDRLSEPHKR